MSRRALVAVVVPLLWALAAASSCALEALPALGSPCDAEGGCPAGYACRAAQGICVPAAPAVVPPTGLDAARPEPVVLIAPSGATVTRDVSVEGPADTLLELVGDTTLGALTLEGRTLTFTAGGDPGIEDIELRAFDGDSGVVHIEVVDLSDFDHVSIGGGGDDAYDLAGNWLDAVPGTSGSVLFLADGESPRLLGDVQVDEVVVATGAVVNCDGSELLAVGALRSGGDFAEFSRASTRGSVVGHFADLTITAGGPTVAVGPVITSGELSTSGGLNFDTAGQTIVVGGDLSVGGDSILSMRDPATLVVVKGDAVFQGRNTNGELGAGRLEVLGNFRQAAFNFDVTNFLPSGTHETVFRGAAAQQVTFDNLEGGFNDVVVANVAGVLFGSDARIDGALEVAAGAAIDAADTELEVGGACVVEKGARLTASLLVTHRPTAFAEADGYGVTTLRARAGTDVLQPDLPYVDIEIQSAVELGGAVAASGAVRVSEQSSVLVIGDGSLTAQSLSVENRARLEMQSLAGSVTVGAASFSGLDLGGSLTAGRFTVSGDFSQSFAEFVNRTFVSSANHEVVFAVGTYGVTLSTPNDPGSVDGSRFNDVVVQAGAHVNVLTLMPIDGDLTVEGTLDIAAAGAVRVTGRTEIVGGGEVIGAGSFEPDPANCSGAGCP